MRGSKAKMMKNSRVLIKNVSPFDQNAFLIAILAAGSEY